MNTIIEFTREELRLVYCALDKYIQSLDERFEYYRRNQLTFNWILKERKEVFRLFENIGNRLQLLEKEEKKK